MCTYKVKCKKHIPGRNSSTANLHQVELDARTIPMCGIFPYSLGYVTDSVADFLLSPCSSVLLLRKWDAVKREGILEGSLLTVVLRMSTNIALCLHTVTLVRHYQSRHILQDIFRQSRHLKGDNILPKIQKY